MSKVDYPKDQHVHGTAESYFVGFFLSLLLTVIPFYFVVNHILSGTRLLVFLIGCAAMQAITQVVFFLHLGRGPKPGWNVFFFFSTIGITVLVVGGSILIINSLNYNMSPSEKVKKLVNDEAIYQVGGTLTGACRQTKESHVVRIKDGNVVEPSQITASKCDVLTFVNESNVSVEIAFGKPKDNGSYAGERDIAVSIRKPATITLSDVGSFTFYNRLDEETTGSFVVNE